MSRREHYNNSVLRERWDDSIRTYTAWDAQGVQTEQRPYTAEENADADQRAAAELLTTNKSTIQQQAEQALIDNRAFIASTPTQATAIAQTKDLSRQVNGIIRLLLDKLDGTD